MIKIKKRILFLLEAYRLYGFKEMLRLLWTGLCNLGKTRLILVALSTPQPLLKSIKAAENHTIKFASVDELYDLKKDPSNEIAEIDIKRVEKGGRCLIQMDGDILVGYSWLWPNQLPYITDGVHINIPSDTVYNYKGYTALEYRGYGFQALRHLEMLKQLKDNGVKRLFGFVDQFNSKSLKGVKKSGYVKVGELLISHKKSGKVKVRLDVDEDFWSNKAHF